MVLSPKSQALYQLLLQSSQPLFAKQIATKLHIFSSTVYRLVEPLANFGLITKSNKYPYRFSAKPLDEGQSLFLLNQSNWFSDQFSNGNNKREDGRSVSESENIQFSFVQSRDELMNESAIEIAKATKSIDILRSGHEIPAEVMLAIREVKKRKVLTRMLIQNYSKDNADQVAYWKQNGIMVRKTPLAHIRLMIYDAKTIYFMSYKNTDSQKDLGMRVAYPPFAVVLSQLFEQWWKKAKLI